MNDQYELPLNTGSTRLQNAFNDFIANHPDVLKLFEALTFSAIEKGHKRLSAYMVIQRMRWEFMVVTNEKPYKLNNNLIPYFARHFHNKYPQYEGFFELRKVIGDIDNLDDN